MGDITRPLAELLTRARTRGFLGPGSVEDHIRHARGFAKAVGRAPANFLDLGSGGGIPGLVLLILWPEAHAVLLDSGQARAQFLMGAVAELGLERRAAVLGARAEEAGRDASWRGRFQVVVARSFGRPPVTAECGSPFLCVGGRLVVSEPPTAPQETRTAPAQGDFEPVPEESEARPASAARWPASGLARLGLADAGVCRPQEGTFRVLVQRELCPHRYPRRIGTPSKRPLF